MAGALWGITALQTYNYFLQYYRVDRPALNLLVGVVFTLDTAHQIIISHMLYSYLVSGWGDLATLGALIWSVLMMVLLTGIIGLVVQTFLIYRVWVLSRRNYIVAGIIALPVVGLFGCSLAYVIQAWPFKLFTDLAKVGGLSRAVNVLGAVSDTVIAIALCYYLWTSKSGIKRTDAIMNRLMLFCVRTGLLTTACAILSLITISALPATFIYICFYSILARFYSFSLLATLNARSDLRKQKGGQGSSFTTSVTLDSNYPSTTNTWNRTGQESRGIVIKQDVETMVSQEYEMKPKGQELGYAA